MATYTTEITSDKLVSDNPIHQRLLKAYVVAKELVSGDVLEVGCGEGRGVSLLLEKAKTFKGIDKIHSVVEHLQKQFPEAIFEQSVIPPFSTLADNSFDTVVSFQVIEHIQNDQLFLKEIYRVLKPGGKALISTPNRKQTLSRNPWHIREYTASELLTLCQKVFDKVEAKGIGGNEKIWQYHEANRKSVQRIMRFDVFDLQHRLPAAVLRWPYEILNRMNRNKLKNEVGSSVVEINHEDYLFVDNPESGLDLFFILGKS